MHSEEVKKLERCKKCNLTEQDLIILLTTSILAPLMNKIKCTCEFPLKNKPIASHLLPHMRYLAENLLPFYLSRHKNNYSEVKHMHTLCYLLA